MSEYLILIYESEQAYAEASAEVYGEVMEAHNRFAEQVGELGCGLALDDFGAGFASFHYLKYLEFDFVKIDGGLVRDVVHSPGDQRILRCIVDLAQGLGKRTIAEWVTDEATLEVMRTFGVDYAQGFHVSVPSALPGLAATS
jgi:EAL domain-containing protein (putative c-di-GMP-specific phosphodiesterase class I)